MTTIVVDPKKFEIFKEIKSRDFKDFSAEQPYHNAMHWFDAVLASHHWTIPEMAAALEGKGQVVYNTLKKTNGEQLPKCMDHNLCNSGDP